MPTYEYVCDACSHQFEKYQPITSSPIRKCPACGKRKVRRLLGTGAGIIFKGSGFYQTDYRSDGYRKAAAAEGPGSSSKGESGKSDASAKTDAAPAKKDAAAAGKAAG